MQTHIKARLATYPLAHQRFAHVNIDIVGPLSQSQDHRYLLTIVDRFTRWPEAIPMPDATVKTCARAFLFNWVARFGVPTDISTDRGPQFTAHLWDTLVHYLLGARLHLTCAYHPQANSLVEHFHRYLKSLLMARLKDSNWVDETAMRTLRNTFNTQKGFEVFLSRTSLRNTFESARGCLLSVHIHFIFL